MIEPCKAIKDQGGQADIASPKPGRIQGMRHHDKGDTIAVDFTIEQVRSRFYDGLVLPVGVANPDALRLDPQVVAFVRDFFEAKRPVAAICHGRWTLIEAEVVRGKTLTSWPSLKTDLKNAGAVWVDREVVADEGLVTSRRPGDLPAFCQEMIKAFRDTTSK